MNLRSEYKSFLLIFTGFMVALFLPVENLLFRNSIFEALALVKWYAREHVVLCLLPAFFIAGSIGVFLSQGSVMKYLGSKANKFISYGVASVSGTILAVCSCTVLPLFAGIYKKGAGIGPATAFLYSGPAINALAIILTARVLGMGLGIARTVSSIFFSIVIGLCMAFIFKDEEDDGNKKLFIGEDDSKGTLLSTALFVGVMILILVFANWGNSKTTSGLFYEIHRFKWIITALLSGFFAILLYIKLKIKWYFLVGTAIVPAISSLIFPQYPMVSFGLGVVALSLILLLDKNDEAEYWFDASWDFAKQILPLLFAGVLVAGFLLGSPTGNRGIIPPYWINYLVGGNSIFANFFASVVGALMYFATLTEIPILKGLMSNGMGKGPALALLLAGPALSLPNMLVIRSIMGTIKTVTFIMLVVIFSTITGFLYGWLF